MRKGTPTITTTKMSPPTESSPLLASSFSRTSTRKKSFPCRVLSRVTVEPAMFLQAVAHGIDLALLANLTVDKLCSVHFGFDAETCLNLDAGNHTAEQDQVQHLASSYNMYINWIEYFSAIFGSLVLGSLGDARGRRLPVLFTFTGVLLTALCFLANVYWWGLPAPLLYLSVLPVGLVGGYIGVSTTTNTYLSSATGYSSRTVSLSAVEWVKYCGYPLGIYLSSALLPRGGYVLVYTFYVLVMLVALLYLVFCVGEPSNTTTEAERSVPFPSVSVREGMVAHLQKTFTVPKSIRQSGRPGAMVAANTVIILLWLLTAGVRTQYFLYERKLFGWQYQQFAKWLVFDFVVKATGFLLVMPTFSYYWQTQDAMLGFIGGVFMLLFYTIFGTAPVAWVLYVASAFSLCCSFPLVTSRSTISKNIAKKDLGAVFALLSVMECCVELVAPPLYTLIYTQTLDIFPGTLFLVMAGVSVILCSVSVRLLTYLDERGSSSSSKNEWKSDPSGASSTLSSSSSYTTTPTTTTCVTTVRG